MKPFNEVFPMLPSQVIADFHHAGVKDVTFEEASGKLIVWLYFADGSFPDTQPLATTITTTLGVKQCTLRSSAPFDAFRVSFANAIIAQKLPSANSLLADAEWTISDGSLHITPKRSIPPHMVETLQADCLSALAIYYENLTYVEISEGSEEVSHVEHEANRASRLRKIQESMPALTPVGTSALLGSAFVPTPILMEQIGAETTKVCVQGHIFSVESAETRTGVRLSFDITDFTSSVRVQRFYPTSSDFQHTDTKVDPKTILSLVKPGMTVAVKGKMEWKRYGETEEQILRPDAILPITIPMTRMDDAPQKRVELHLHTNMSDMDALTDPDKLMKRLTSWGHTAVGITDHGVVHAFPTAMNARSKHIKDKDFKVLYGCEAYFVDAEKLKNRSRHSFHIILFATNAVGLRNLYELISKAHIENFHRHPNVTRADLTQYREGLLIGSACEAGELFSDILAGCPWEELVQTCSFYDYLEIQPICNNRFLIDKKLAADNAALQNFNRTIVSLGDATGKPVVATGDVHFLDPEDEIYRKILLCSKDMIDDNPLPLFLRTTQEMLDEFSYLGAEKAFEVVVTNTNLIADRCQPIQPIRKNEFFPPHIVGSAEELRHLSMTRAEELYGNPIPDHIYERIQVELEPIIKGGYDVIYMTAQKLVAQSLKDGYLVGSRGSVGSSLVAFLAGITEVNALSPHYRCATCCYSEFPETPTAACGVDMPAKDCPTCRIPMVRDGFNIPFATFLGFEADKKPDIDLNFSGEYQFRAHQNTVELFGAQNVFKAGTIATVAAKTAVGFVLKYMEKEGHGLPPAEINRLAKGCEGVRRTTGQHPGGLIVVPAANNINEFTPIQHPANKKGDIITTHFDYHSIEDNLLKLDLLGHDDPTMIRHMEDMTGIKVQNIDLGDPATMSLFTTSKALGFENDSILGVTGACDVPEFGTRFVREMLVQTKPTTFDELVRISGLSHGAEVWLGNAADLVAAGTATLKEVVCARDDIMVYLIQMGMDKLQAFHIMESVRKGKGLKPEWEQDMKTVGVPAWYISSCKKIQYMFPRAHAVAYVMSAFRIAWFKVNYPKAFYSAYFTIRAGGLDANVMVSGIDKLRSRILELLKLAKPTANDKDKLTMLEVCYEFYRRGFCFEQISLLHSDAKRFTITDKGLRLPFIAMPGLGDKAAEELVKERDKQAFLSIDELSARCKGLDKTNIEKLRDAGALGDLPDSMQITLF